MFEQQKSVSPTYYKCKACHIFYILKCLKKTNKQTSIGIWQNRFLTIFCIERIFDIFILWRKIVKDRLQTYISAVQISLNNRIQIFIVTTFISFLGKKVFLSSLRLSIKRSPRNWKIWFKIGYAWQYFLISIWTHVWKVTIKYCCYSVLFNNSTFFVKNWTLQAIVILHFGFANYSLNILQMFLIMLSNFLFWKSSF